MLIGDLDILAASLVLAALLIGATGTWSPCGFSMIETIGPTGHDGGLATTFAALATFVPAAVLGAVVTFASLAWLGFLLQGAGQTAAHLLAAALALAAAIAEARGLRIAPQVRRQLPIGWRASLPMPVASAGYGVLLGLGFTTFVLSYGVWALIGISLAVGDPSLGLAIGIAFGIGRALPIAALAPFADRPAGERACEAMAMRAGLYRGARRADAVALALVAVALTGTAAAAGPGEKTATTGFDPAASGPLLAYERDGGAFLRRADGSEQRLPGSDPATGGPWIAVLENGGISLLGRNDLRRFGRIPAESADSVAVSSGWVAWRARRGDRDILLATSIADPARPGPVKRIATAKGPGQLGRPSLSGRRLVYAVAKQRRNHLVLARLGTKKGVGRETIRSSRMTGLSNPAAQGSALAYVQTTATMQRIRLSGLGAGKGETIYRRRTGRGTLWSLALGAERVYATVIKRSGGTSIISIPR